jgi:hypothetical protein
MPICVQAFQISLAIVVACIAIQILSRELDIFERPLICGNKEYWIFNHLKKPWSSGCRRSEL